MARFPVRALFAALAIPAAFAVPGALADPATLREAREAVAALAGRHRAAAAFTLAFESRALDAAGEPMPPVRGTLVAADSGRFRLTHAQDVALDPASVGESLDSLVLLLSADGKAVRGLETQDPAGNRVSYKVSSLRYDARPGRGAFEFKVPAEAEVVDMR